MLVWKSEPTEQKKKETQMGGPMRNGDEKAGHSQRNDNYKLRKFCFCIKTVMKWMTKALRYSPNALWIQI